MAHFTVILVLLKMEFVAENNGVGILEGEANVLGFCCKQTCSHHNKKCCDKLKNSSLHI